MAIGFIEGILICYDFCVRNLALGSINILKMPENYTVNSSAWFNKLIADKRNMKTACYSERSEESFN